VLKNKGAEMKTVKEQMFAAFSSTFFVGGICIVTKLILKKFFKNKL